MKDRLNKVVTDIDLYSLEVYRPGFLKSDDVNSRYRYFRLHYNEEPIDVSGLSAKAYMLKSDGKEVWNNLTIEEGLVVLEFTQQALASPGPLSVEIVLSDSDTTFELSSFILHFEVIRSLRTDASIESTNEFGVLQAFLRDLSGANENYKTWNDKLEALYNKYAKLLADSEGGGGTGADGREIELQKSETHIQWRYVGELTWRNLIAIEDLRGEQGIQGPVGPKGDKGEQGPPGIVSDEALKPLQDTDIELENEITDLNAKLGGKSFKYLTQLEYNTLSEEEKNNPSIVYCITDAENKPIENNSELTSPNGDKWVLKVSNEGVLSVEKVIINTPVQSVSLNKTTHTMKVDETIQLSAVITPPNASNKEVTWSANNSNCTVNDSGLVAAKAEGECIITVTTKDGNKTDTCVITVESKEGVNPLEFTNYIYNSDTYTNPATGLHPNAGTYYLKYKCSISVEGGVATVTKTGNDTDAAYLLVKQGRGDGNKYYTRCLVKTTANNVNAGNNSDPKRPIIPNDDSWHLVSFVFADSSVSSNGFTVNVKDCVSGSVVYIKELMQINLTEIYGSGNEPTKDECDTIFTTYKSGLVG